MASHSEVLLVMAEKSAVRFERRFAGRVPLPDGVATLWVYQEGDGFSYSVYQPLSGVRWPLDTREEALHYIEGWS